MTDRRSLYRWPWVCQALGVEVPKVNCKYNQEDIASDDKDISEEYVADDPALQTISGELE